MPKRRQQADAPKKSDTVRVEEDIASKATLIAIRRGVSVSELLSPILRPIIEREYVEEVRKMNREIGTK